MSKSIIEFLNLPQIPTGPGLTALRRVRELASGVEGATELSSFVEEAIAASEALFRAEQRWKSRRRRAEHGERAVDLDRRLGKIVSGIAGALLAQQNVAVADPEWVERCVVMTKALFPDGVGAVTQLRFSDQSQAIRVLLEQVDEEPDFRVLARELRFASGLETLRVLNEEYAQEISAHMPLDFEKIRAERRRSRERLGGVVARIFGLFPDESESDRAARGRLLAPIERQVALQRATNRRHRRKERGEDEVELISELEASRSSPDDEGSGA